MMETFKAKYAPLDDDESVSSTGEIDANIRQLLHRQWPPQPQWAMRLFALLPWVSTLAFASLSLILYFRQFRTTSSLGTYEAGFRTDLSKFIFIQSNIFILPFYQRCISRSLYIDS